MYQSGINWIHQIHAFDRCRYQGCEPLVLSCPSCSSSFDCPPLFSSICSLISQKPADLQAPGNFWLKLHCPTCFEEGDQGSISPASIANQVFFLSYDNFGVFWFNFRALGLEFWPICFNLRDLSCLLMLEPCGFIFSCLCDLACYWQVKRQAEGFITTYYQGWMMVCTPKTLLTV